MKAKEIAAIRWAYNTLAVKYSCWYPPTLEIGSLHARRMNVLAEMILEKPTWKCAVKTLPWNKQPWIVVSKD